MCDNILALAKVTFIGRELRQKLKDISGAVTILHCLSASNSMTGKRSEVDVTAR